MGFVVQARGYRRDKQVCLRISGQSAGSEARPVRRELTVTLTTRPTSAKRYMRDRMRQRPDVRPQADDAPTGPVPRVAVPAELPRPQTHAEAESSAEGSLGGH